MAVEVGLGSELPLPLHRDLPLFADAPRDFPLLDFPPRDLPPRDLAPRRAGVAPLRDREVCEDEDEDAVAPEAARLPRLGLGVGAEDEAGLRALRLRFFELGRLDCLGDGVDG